jgi:hypothetical protein
MLISNGVNFDEEYINTAAKEGYLSILKWLKANNCPWNAFAASGAAAYNNFSTLKWIVKNDGPVDKNIMYSAIRSDNLFLVQWLYNRGHTRIPPAGLNFVKSNFELLRWLDQKGARFEFEFGRRSPIFDLSLITNIIKEKAKDVMLWMMKKPGISEIMHLIERLAAKYSQLDFFDFLIQNKIIVNSKKLSNALIVYGRTDLFLWIYNKYPEFNLIYIDTATFSVRMDNILFTKWLLEKSKEKGYRLDSQAYIYACENNNTEFLDFIKEEIPKPEEDIIGECYHDSAILGNFEVIKWLTENGFDYEIDGGDNTYYPEIAGYLIDHGATYNQKTLKKLKLKCNYEIKTQ